MHTKHIIIIFFVLTMGISCRISAQETPFTAGLSYDKNIVGPVPVPPSERLLQTVSALPYFKVSDKEIVLEGAIFDNVGNLLFCDVTGRRVLKLSPKKQLTTILKLDSLSPGGLAFHPDGRLFIAALNLDTEQGGIFSVNPDGTDLKAVVLPKENYMPNDLTFDAEGGFYFTDFKGNSTEPKGGVYYVAPDLSSITEVVRNLSMANGVTLTAGGKDLWVTEFGRNLLHRITLIDATTIAPTGSAIAYHFIGPAPDSMRADADGNLYVAIYGQGRIMVFNPHGIPIGQILYPDRDNGYNLLSTSLAIRPGTNDLYGVTSDGGKGKGSNIFHAKVFGKGLSIYCPKDN